MILAQINPSLLLDSLHQASFIPEYSPAGAKYQQSRGILLVCLGKQQVGLCPVQMQLFRNILSSAWDNRERGEGWLTMFRLVDA